MCSKEGIGYSSTCTRCRVTDEQEEGRPPDNYTYIGETARTLYTRANQHLTTYRSHLPSRKGLFETLSTDRNLFYILCFSSS